MKGLSPDYAKVEEPQMFYGRFINEMDMQQRRKVCVIGKKTYKDLFPKGGDPCGQSIRIDSIYYQSGGCDYGLMVHEHRWSTRRVSSFSDHADATGLQQR